MIPDAILSRIRSEMEGDVQPVRRLTGGSINEAGLVKTTAAGECFLKWNLNPGAEMFDKEVHGLRLLKSATDRLRIPEPVIWGEQYLLMEYVPKGYSTGDSAEAFGRALSHLHRQTHEQFGLDHDNYIGSLPQANDFHDEWGSFFCEQRIRPQLRMAVDTGKLPSDITGLFDTLFRKIFNIFPEEPPALLHGDLWGGNFFYNQRGEPVLFDPAVYYGHREMELAFTHLFGGFSPAFHESYREEFPLAPGFSERRDIYNLYPLLVHTNLFGGSYARQVERVVKRFQ